MNEPKSIEDIAQITLYDQHDLLAINKPAGYESVAQGNGKCLTSLAAAGAR